MSKEHLRADVRMRNKKAEYAFFLLERFTAGIVLAGTEIKSIRQGKAAIGDSYCYFNGGELFIKNMYVAEYTHGTYYNHEPRRERKLLLTKRELRKLSTKMKEKGLTIIPVQLFIDENGRAKLEIALSKGKKAYDKRESIKEKDLRRDMARTADYRISTCGISAPSASSTASVLPASGVCFNSDSASVSSKYF